MIAITSFCLVCNTKEVKVLFCPYSANIHNTPNTTELVQSPKYNPNDVMTIE